ncbi:MAG: alpha/beta hydrolase [Alphaproteobacteria bacterium]|nr:alpha/beta hydrolase [Alphaproteobacteria bacterium]
MPTIRANGSTVAFRETGRGTPVILLHASASCSTQWTSLIDKLGPWHQVLAPDLYGCGDSDRWLGWHPLDLAEEAAVVTALMARCASPVHLVGHSYGGAVALRVALEHPDWVRSLTVVEPTAFYLLGNGDRNDRALFDEVRALADDVEHAISLGNFDRATARIVTYWGGSGAWDTASAVQRATLRRAIRQIPHQFDSVFNEMTTLNAFRHLHVPTLVLRGEASPQPTRRVAEMLGAVLPMAHLETIAQAGHMMPLTHATTINELISDHLNRGYPVGLESNVA